MSRIRTVATALTVIASLSVLAGCTGPAAPASTDAAGGSAPKAAASPAASPTPSAEPAASCLQIDTTAPTIDGPTLGACISDALHAVGTFKARSNMSGEQQSAEIRLRPDVALHGKSPDDEVIYVDETAYTNEGDGWIKGDVDSADSKESIAGAAGLMLLSVFAGDLMKQTIAACPVWNIEVGSTKLTLPDDKVVDARVFACAAPVDMFGVTSYPMNVWIGADWTPYGYESTATGYGQVVEGTSYYYDHGKPVEITAPM